ncbi:Na+/H+ antiporter subunit E [Granulicoccus phenolivorans]|uniref:Na+/H+ antiporter subunit E n=1 Tax=Granulicoccus phenolivorans TaxID=266854 RepID=UPI0003F6DF83|nr:Na+/H+ antiporter subunit E [Granulicoccus phenolivorans]
MKQKLWRLYRSARLGSILALTLLWVALWGRPSVGTFVLGFLIAAASVHLFPMPRAGSRLKIHPVWLCWLLLVFFHDLVVASFVVGFKAIRPSGVARGRIVTVQLQGHNDFRRVMTAELTSLVPGTVVIDLDGATSEMVVHILDHADDARVAREVAHIHALELRVRKAFGGLEPQEWEDA